MSDSGPPRERQMSNLATVALAAVTASVAVGLGRLVVDTSLIPPTLVALAVAHGAAWVGRRLDLSTALGIGLSLLAGFEAIVIMRYAGSSTAGLPNGTVLSAIASDLQEAWSVFGAEGAPAPVADGFIVAAMAAVVVIAATSDALAFRAVAPVEALAPAGGLFVFTTVLEGPDHRVSATALMLSAAFGFLLVERVARRAGAGHWLGGPGSAGPPALLRAGAGLAALGVAGAVFVGPVLPGASARPVIDLDDEGNGDRVAVNPLVQIQARLVDQPDVEVFTVRSDRRAYWRLTALDRFDGAVWSADGDYVGVDRALESGSAADADRRTSFRQQVELLALGDTWLPAAFEPVGIDAGSMSVRWDPVSSSLVTDQPRTDGDTVRYEVVSASPVIDRALASTASAPGPAFDDLRALPDGFSATARRVARQATDGAQTTYEQALALQDFFRDGFSYSLDVAAGHGIDDIDDFLRRRVGYCEQFAGTYAALARSLGLPARVAVGFTPGEVDPDEPDLFHVRGEHAHAWPEVHLGDLGWVAFEPTPGRGAPGAESYTGVSEQQQGEAEPGAPGATTTTSPAPGAPSDQATPAPTAGPPVGDASTGPASDTGPPPLVRVLAAMATMALGWVVGVPAWRFVRRQRARRSAMGHPAAQVEVAWGEAVGGLARAGVHRRPAETPDAFVTRVHPVAIDPLADAVTTLWYGGPALVDATMAEQARQASAKIVGEARLRSGRRRWFVSGLDPRAH